LNDLSLNSVISYPNHNDTILIKDYIDKKVVLKGYAHAGGGRPVTRVEISTSRGESWELAEIHRTEKPNPYGKYWCWIWWSFPVDAAKLNDEIWVRAWDTTNSPQPENPTWTLMGQSSNVRRNIRNILNRLLLLFDSHRIASTRQHFFKVKVHISKESTGQPVYRFEHPTQPGQQTGGWATRAADKVKSAGYGRISSLSDGKVL
jgi:nitrate reductase (NAD(P)H)